MTIYYEDEEIIPDEPFEFLDETLTFMNEIEEDNDE